MAREQITLKLKIDRVALAQVSAQFAVGMNAVRKSAHSMVLERLQKKGLTDAQLERLDHPYARRHGSIKSINSSPTEYVGRRTGSILRSLKSKVSRAGSNQYSTQYSAIVEFKNPPDHGKMIFKGTRIMLPRNPLMVVTSPKATNLLVNVFQKSVKL